MNKIIMYILGTMMLLVSCEKEWIPTASYLKVSNHSVSVSPNSIRLSCDLYSNADIDEAYVECDIYDGFASVYKKKVQLTRSGSSRYSATITGLNENTTYYIRYEGVDHNSGKINSEVYKYKTSIAGSPSVSTTSVTDVSYTSATVGGNVTSDGGSTVTERGVVYSTSQNPMTSNAKKTSGSGTGSFSVNLSDLSEGTTYYARAYAINSKGTSYGEQVSFTTTKESSVPSVLTSSASDVSYTSATVGGNVTSDGGSTVTERGVVYSTSQNPTTSNAKKTSGSGTGSFSVNLSGLSEGTTYYVRAYAINSKGTSYGEQANFTTETSDGSENSHYYVDLGLSVKWATCNVGASQPEEYGDYFAWGETSPKSTYNESTYKWCNGSSRSLTKYCTKSDYGTVDNKTQLELSDDAARANWGGSWRMPTYDEWTELREKCTWTWTTQNGVYGYKVTSKTNGRSIFLPAAGFRSGSFLYSTGSYGYYWSSSLLADYPSFAWSEDFNSSDVDWDNSTRRFEGQSVRPVCP